MLSSSLRPAAMPLPHSGSDQAAHRLGNLSRRRLPAERERRSRVRSFPMLSEEGTWATTRVPGPKVRSATMTCAETCSCPWQVCSRLRRARVQRVLSFPAVRVEPGLGLFKSGQDVPLPLRQLLRVDHTAREVVIDVTCPYLCPSCIKSMPLDSTTQVRQFD